MTTTILVGDVRERLNDIPDGSVQCVCTSPPYYGLRNYNVDGQIGLEPTLAGYLAAMVEVFRGVRRVLRDDGVVWLNIGSSYASRIIESDAYVMRDDLTDAERTYVYAELARHFEAESQAVSGMRSIDAPAEQEVSAVPRAGKGTTSELRDEGV
jgi:DNA modification methylase